MNKFVSARIAYYVVFIGILLYLWDTLSRSLIFSFTFALELHTYIDADWASDPTVWHFTIGFCVLISASLSSWKIQKQDIVARSSPKVEYLVIVDTVVAEVVWLCLIFDIDVSLRTPTLLYYVNKRKSSFL